MDRRCWKTEEEFREYIVEWCQWSTDYLRKPDESEYYDFADMRVRSILKEAIAKIEIGG